ncbi:MAG: DUF1934 domain-containing protein [Clostridia bacterium]|nr:DUF1934 domain-containing protein [Clostridia bacterium]MEE1185694.1 DUF1934 domain-containing protein [Acutalibacteraceae bacterium]
MIKDVLISIKGIQGIDGDTDTIEFKTTGRYGVKNGGYYMSYEENELMGAKGIKTILHVKEDDTVVLQRSGAMQSRLIVQKGKRNACFYSTPQGELMIGIFGENVENSLKENGGRLSMCYTIDSNLQLISRNEVEILVKEVN